MTILPARRADPGRLRAFLEALPEGFHAAFEFRDESWFEDDVLAALAAHRAAFCIYELAGRRSPEPVTADFCYLRLHGPGAAYSGSYDDASLRRWASKILAWQADGIAVYVYFDNDEAGHAVHDAERLMAMVERG